MYGDVSLYISQLNEILFYLHPYLVMGPQHFTDSLVILTVLSLAEGYFFKIFIFYFFVYLFWKMQACP